jgi:hypothetical protein
MAKVFKFALITSRGIYINNLFYSCSKAIRDQWFHHAEISGPWLVPVIYSTETLEFIRVIHCGEIHVANLLPERSLYPFQVKNQFGDRETS